MYFDVYEKEPDKLSADKLSELIMSGISYLDKGQSLEIGIPFNFAPGSSEYEDKPLILTVKRVDVNYKNPGKWMQKGFSVDKTDYDQYEISDGGRALHELERKIGDIETYIKRIERILYKMGELTLRGGRIITYVYDESSPYSHYAALSSVMTAVTTVANLDILPPYTER